MLPERAFQPRNGRMNMTLEGGGGGTTQSTVTQSNIPEWLRPQTEALLGAATQEYFETTPRKTATGQTVYDITGIKPYTPYSADPSQYFASFTPQQEDVFKETAGLQTPGAFGAAGQLMGAAGQGALESTLPAYLYGGQGQQSGLYGQGIGFSYGQMATDPAAVRAYMSPYQQGVTDIAKTKAIEDAQKSQLQANLASSRQGTYGGARQALLQGQRESALTKQLSDIQTQGLQSAYDRAIQSQQFGVTAGMQGAGLGIQGAQAGLQGLGAAQAGYGMAGQLGQGLTGLGQTQQASDLARLGFQAEIGALPQAQRQAIIDQSIQNYAYQQENPYQRLSQFNALLRGYATPTTTIDQYGGGANTLQALGALGTAAGGVGTLMGVGKKAGGVIKLAEGGGITDKDALESFAERSSIPQLQQSMQSGSLPKYIGMPILENEVAKAERMKMNQMLMAQGQQQGRPSISDEIVAKADQLQGITDVATGAGGGIVAFDAGGLVTPRILQDALNKVSAAKSPQEKQAAQSAYNDLLKAYQMQISSASDTGAGIGDVRPGGGIAPSTKPAPVIAAPVEPKPKPEPEPKPEPQGITSIVEPTRQEEVAQYLKDRAAIMGEDEYAKALKARAEKEPSFYDKLSSAGAQIGLAGSMLRDPSKFGTYAQQAAELQGAQQKSAEQRELAALEAQKAERETKGKAFDVVEGRRQDLAKEKRTEAREIAAEKRAEKTKEKLTRLEASLRKDPDAFNREVYNALNSKDPDERAGAERWLSAKQSASYKKMTEKEAIQAAQIAAGGETRWMMLSPTQRNDLILQAKEGRLGQSSYEAPAVGTVMDGYKFKGGNPSDPKNWEKV